MLTIHAPEIIERENDTVLQADFECDGIKDTLWFSTSKEWGKYLCHERGDAFLVALLPIAMKQGEDIKVLAPISERLYYTLTKHFIKVLADTYPGFHPVRITCDIDRGHLPSAGGVGTALSCGIDSFCTIIEHTDDACPPDFKLTHLTFFNTFHREGNKIPSELYHERKAIIEKCAEELGLPLVTADSNIGGILFIEPPDSVYQYRNVAAVLAFQKLFKLYHYSSTHTPHQFTMDWHEASLFEIYAMNMLATNDTQLLVCGENYSRVEKTDIVSQWPFSYKNLNVCIIHQSDVVDRNCSRCGKCQRTLTTLDLLGKIDLYNGVFDLDDYYKNRTKYFASIILNRHRNPFQREIYEAIQASGFRVPFGSYYYMFRNMAWKAISLPLSLIRRTGKRLLGKNIA